MIVVRTIVTVCSATPGHVPNRPVRTGSVAARIAENGSCVCPRRDGFALRISAIPATAPCVALPSAIYGGHQRILTYRTGNKPLKIINKWTLCQAGTGDGLDQHRRFYLPWCIPRHVALANLERIDVLGL